MPGPAAGEVARADGPVRVRLRDAVVPLAVILALGLVLRLIIAYVLLPGSGFGADRSSFDGWSLLLAANGPWHFYSGTYFVDYTPGYLYVLWGLGWILQVLGGPGTAPGDLMKLPAILADAGLALAVFALVADLGGRRRAAIAAAAIVTFVPITWFDSAVWSQVDSVGTLFLLLAVRDLWRGRDARATVLTTIAAIIKPQFGILIPLAAVWMIRREFAAREHRYRWDDLRLPFGTRWVLWPVRFAANLVEGGRSWWWDDDISWAIRLLGLAAIAVSLPPDWLGDWAPLVGSLSVLAAVLLWLRDRDLGRGFGRIVGLALAGLATAQAVCLPFGITVSQLAMQIVKTAGGYPYATVNAYNPWALVTQEPGGGLAQYGTWIRDVFDPTNAGATYLSIAGIPAVFVGSVVLVAVIAALAAVLWRRDDRRTFLVTLTVLSIAFFVLPTRVHERYLYPFFALGAVVVVLSPRWWWIYAALAAANFANMFGVLTTPFYKNPGLQPMLDAVGGLGGRLADAIRSLFGVTVAAAGHVVGLAGAAVYLARPSDPEVDSRVPEADLEPAASQAVARADATPDDRRAGGPAPGALGLGVPAAASEGGARASRGGPRAWFDRSRLLHGEGGGRLDRLDIWFVAVLAVASLCLRTFGLGEPMRMHFDEVYHARTAAEFLQDWRYGHPHYIYEYTHPHVAKYAIAGGLVAFGNDQVVSSSELGVPVAAAAIEPSWSDPGPPALSGGDRLYVATGSSVVVYDLRTRALLATYPVPGATSLAVDADPNNGRAALVYVGTGDGHILTIDPSGAGAGAAPPAPTELGTVGGAISGLWSVGGGASLVAATPSDGLAIIDSSTGSEVGHYSLPGRADVADAGTVDAVIATPSAVTGPAAEAAQLALILGGTQAQYEALLRDSAADVTITAAIGDHRAELEAAINGGKLPGVRIDKTVRIAVADTQGVSFVAATTGQVTSTVAVDGGATSLTAVEGADVPELYAAAGATLAPIRVPADGSTPTLQNLDGGGTSVWMPAVISKVTFDSASQVVHALGRTPDGTGWTIYAVEPKGNSVFADAKLAFEPAAWAIDQAPDQPATDRQQILAFGADGSAAAVSIGQHAFAWRLPGVIAGAIMAALLYLLARLLFRRRSVAILAGVFGLLDGMFFVQQRIAMNDTYVDLFIVAGLTLFAAIWTGAWRWRGAFWVGMPIVGVLMGLGLASKWVGLYALGALFLLILARSALGRVVIVLGLAAISAVLGYMGLVVPPDAANGPDFTFLFLMVGLTVVAAAITVLHPIAWSPEEVWFAVAGPAALGALATVAALGLGLGTRAILVGLGLMGVGGAAALAFWLAGRVGLGPLAPPPAPDDPVRLLPPADPPPDGWLRPGWLFGVPVAWAAVSLLVIPLAVYIATYIPWALSSIGDPVIFPAGTPIIGLWPPGHTGQTLWQLTQSMYDYHNNLRVGHPASSPWWAWPLDLKPVWFYQQAFAGSTTGAIYDGGNVALWWLSIPAVAWGAWQSFKRRSLGLGFLVIVIACMWLAWARIDRATFEYHYYSTIPFVLLALAYFVAELWHGPSRRTWLLARAAAAAAILAPVALWLASKPFCGFVGVERANPGSQACSSLAALPISLSAQASGMILVLILGAGPLVWLIYRLDSKMRAGATPEETRPATRRLMLLGAAVGALLVAAATLLPGTPFIDVPSLPAEVLAVVLLAALAPFAWLAATARSPRRFVAAILVVAVVTFVAFYPNWSGLPLPNGIFNFYQGIIPTWVYPFQFPVNVDAPVTASLTSTMPLLLLVAVPIVAALIAYAAWVWRLTLAERQADEEAGGAGATTG